jgi:hypothetical protein
MSEPNAAKKKSDAYPSRDEVEEAISAILYADGPDRHVDGYEIIADYVMAVIERTDKTWLEFYLERSPDAARFGDFRDYFKRVRP